MKKTILILVLLALIFSGGRTGHAETLVIPGTGACEIVLKDLAKTFNAQNSGHEVIIPTSTGSGGGILSLLTNQALLARVARPLKGNEAKQGLSYLVFAKDAVIFAVGAQVEVQGLTTTQLIEIFSGQIRDWREVGGNKAAIRLLFREPSDSGLRTIKEHIEPFQNIRIPVQSKILYHEYEMVEMLAKYKNSIGWLSRSSILAGPSSIKPLAVDNISPTLANISTGKYELVGDFALVYKQNKLSNLARQFIDFIFSDAAKSVMNRHGVIPANRK